MTAAQRTLSGLIVLIALLVMGAFGIQRYGVSQYDAGHAAAVAEGKEARDTQTADYRIKESELREQLRKKDDLAFTKEKLHAESIEAVQRRMRAGTDSLRCPTRAVPTSDAAAAGSAAGGSSPDAGGQAVVPEAAADFVSVAGHIAGLVRRYARLEERFEQCRAMNAR